MDLQPPVERASTKRTHCLTEEHIRRMLHDYLYSAQGVDAICEHHGVDRKTLYYYINKVKVPKRIHQPLRALQPSDPPSPEVVASNLRKYRQARRAPELIPARMKEVVRLYVYEGLSSAAIGQRLAVSRATIASDLRQMGLTTNVRHPKRLSEVDVKRVLAALCEVIEIPAPYPDQLHLPYGFLQLVEKVAAQLGLKGQVRS